jgi:hypothetical protein
MHLAASDALAAMKHRAMNPVHTLKILPILLNKYIYIVHALYLPKSLSHSRLRRMPTLKGFHGGFKFEMKTFKINHRSQI